MGHNCSVCNVESKCFKKVGWQANNFLKTFPLKLNYFIKCTLQSIHQYYSSFFAFLFEKLLLFLFWDAIWIITTYRVVQLFNFFWDTVIHDWQLFQEILIPQTIKQTKQNSLGSKTPFGFKTKIIAWQCLLGWQEGRGRERKRDVCRGLGKFVMVCCEYPRHYPDR